MTELVLTRSGDDRRRYDLAGVGSVRRNGLLARSSELRTVPGRVLRAAPVGMLGREAEAVDEAGAVGRFRQRGLLTHGGEVVWSGVSLQLAARSTWRYRCELCRDDVPLLTVRAKGWGRTPARVQIHDERADPGLVLFVLWLVQQFIKQDGSST